MRLRHFLSVRRWRLASGLVLFTYLFTHLINHMLGLFGLDVAERGLIIAKMVWRTPVATAALYGAAAIHLALALQMLYARRDWRLPPKEILRLSAGFSMPMLLIGHAVATRLSVTLHDLPPRYAGVITSLMSNGLEGWQLALLAPGWIHGCMSLWFTLKRLPSLHDIKWVLVVLAALFPIAAGAGFITMMTELAALGLNPQTPALPLDAAALVRRAELNEWRVFLVRSYMAIIVATLIAGPVRRALMSRLVRRPA